jgi:hypothetical protein
MPSLRDVAHDGVLCTFCFRFAPDRGQVVWSVRGDVMDHQVQNHNLVHHSPFEPARRAPCWTNPLAFGLIGTDHRVHKE